jgi:proteasome accessory factor B
MAKSSKVQRWVDLLAALLRRHYAVTLDELVREVPGYAAAPSKAALRRTFERDKDELRRFGVPIRTIEDDAGETVGYQLPAKEFYLPYLSVMQGGRLSAPSRVDREGFRGLQHLAFEPDELAAIAEAAARVQRLGDPLLERDARSAMRKLACDLPIDAVLMEPAVAYMPAHRPDPAAFERLNDALARRKRVAFDYWSIGADTESRRTVEPHGLFFLGQHWYLAAPAPGEDLVKNYRLSRIGAVEVNAASPNTPDYDIRPGFHLREHARSRQAWELGGGGVEAVVDFAGGGGNVSAAARLGEPVEGSETARRFRVSRPDAFARWLLSLGPAARPLSPPALVAEHRRQAEATLALYDPSVVPSSRPAAS